MCKRSLSLSFVAILGLTFSCLPTEREELLPGGVTLTVTTAEEEPDSKTYMESDGVSYTAKWHSGDQAGIFFDSWSAGKTGPDATLTNSASAGRKATFTGTVSVDQGEHTVYAFYPARAFYASEGSGILDLEIPYIQFPTLISYDPKADLLVGVPRSLTVSGSEASIDNMCFRRVCSILELMLSDDTSGSVLTSDKIKSVTVEAPGSALSGVFRYDFSTQDAASTQMAVSNTSVTADLSGNPMAFAGNAVYFMVNPTTIPSGSPLTITVRTDRHEVVKEVTLAEDINLTSGKVVTLHASLGSACTVTDLYWQDNFDWLYQYFDGIYTNAYGKAAVNLRPVETQSTSTSATPPYKQPNIWTAYSSTIGQGFTDRGYVDLAKASGRNDNVLYIQENYLKFGKTNYHTGIQLPAIAFGSSPVTVSLSFDWSAQDAGKNFVVEVTGGGICLDSGSSVSNAFSQTSTLTWETKTLILVGLTSSSRICIRPNISSYAVSGKYRFFVDNIKVLPISDPVSSGNVYGQVVDSSGNPLAGVAVSDGYTVTTTGSDGRYGFYSTKANPYVFISQPQGYEVPLDGVFPQFWQALGSDVDTREEHNFTLTAVDNSNCVLLALGDLHLCDRTALRDLKQFRMQVKELKDKVNDVRSQGLKVYGLTLGDMTWDLYWDNSSGMANTNFDLADYKTEMNSDFSGSEFPIWQTIGNHDHDYAATGDWDTVIPYKTILGPTYYSFNIGGYHIVSLDNVLCYNDGTVSGRYSIGGLTDEILQWLKADMALVGSSTPVIVSMHEPLYFPSNPTGGYYYGKYASSLLSALGSRKIHIVTGHTHGINNVSVSSSLYEHNAGSLCATWWWTGRHSITSEASWGVGTSMSNTYCIGPDGTPAGYTVYELSSGTMQWRYRALGLAETRQFKVYDRNKMDLSAAVWCPSATSARQEAFEEYSSYGDGQYSYVGAPDGSTVPNNLVYINVWNYDPSWTITVTENGTSLTVKKLTDAYDPMHIVAYSAVRYENGNAATAAFLSVKTQHLFRVQTSSASSSLVVTVKDRFGNSSTQVVSRPKNFSVDWN